MHVISYTIFIFPVLSRLPRLAPPPLPQPYVQPPPPAWHQPPRARTKMTDCLEARIRRSTRTGGQAARTGVEAPVRAATGKDVNAHLEWCLVYVAQVQVWWRLQPGGGRCNDNTGRTLIRIHPHCRLQRTELWSTLVIVVQHGWGRLN